MKGRTWCISFQDAATKDGDVTIRYHVTDAQGNPQVIPGTWEGYKRGDTPDKKAERFFNALNSPPYNQLVGVTRAGNTVCFQLKDSAPYRDINGINVGDESGQNFHVYDDPEPGNPATGGIELLETVRFRIGGTPESPRGEVRLGLGAVEPMAVVPTHANNKPLAINALINSLVEKFNAIYTELGFTAQRAEEGEVIIPSVPCKLGVRGGSNDKGLSCLLTMADPVVPAVAPSFDKFRIIRDDIRLINARLNFAGLSQVFFADPELNVFAQVPVLQADPEPCVCKIQLLVPPPPLKVTVGMKTLKVKVKYTANCNGEALTDCAVYVIVDKIDNMNGRRVDSRTTVVNVASPATDREIEIEANTDMDFGRNNAARVTVMLVCNECKPAAAGPFLLDVPAQ